MRSGGCGTNFEPFEDQISGFICRKLVCVGKHLEFDWAYSHVESQRDARGGFNHLLEKS